MSIEPSIHPVAPSGRDQKDEVNGDVVMSEDVELPTLGVDVKGMDHVPASHFDHLGHLETLRKFWKVSGVSKYWNNNTNTFAPCCICLTSLVGYSLLFHGFIRCDPRRIP